MNTILNEVKDCIIVIDKYGNIQFCNEKVLSKLLYKENDLLNSNILNILNSSKDDFIKIIENIHKGDKINTKLSIIDNEKNSLELLSSIFIDKYEDSESIYMFLREIDRKSYNIDDLETLLDSLPFDIWIKDLDGKYIYTNKQYANRMKCTKEDMIGKDNKYYWEKENEGKKFLQVDKEIIKTKMPKIVESEVIQHSKKKYFIMYYAPIIDNKGNVKYTIGSSRDITLKNIIKKGICENNNRLSTLDLIFNQNKDEEKDIDKLLDNIAVNMADSLDADSVAIFLYEKESDSLKLRKTHGYIDLLYDDINSFKLTDSLKEELVQNDINCLHNMNLKTRRALISDKINKKVEHGESYKLIVEGEFIGIITISYLEGNKPKLDYNDFINISCQEIAMIIKNYRLSNELNKELKKRRQLEKNLEVFLDISIDTMGIVDSSGKFKFISPTINEVLYWEDADLLHKPAVYIIHPNEKNELVSIFQKKSARTIRRRNRFLCKNGEYKWLEWNYRYILEKDYYVITCRDITKEKIEEDKRKALESAIELESIKNEFFANISHEFKTPINIILGTMQLLDKYVSNDNIITKSGLDLNKYIYSTKQNSFRLLKLVNNLLDLTRIDTGFYELQLGNYNIINIIESITLSVAQYIENKGINLIFDTNEEEVLLACDPDKIERIVLNLLSNSIKYTNPGGEIFVDLDVRSDKVVISIKDNGLGISKDKLPYIFERFKQGDHLLTRNSEGTGIGLSLVKSLVEMHDGKIYVSSEKGIGSEFTFELPIRLVENSIEIKEDIYEEFKIEKCNIEFSDIYSI